MGLSVGSFAKKRFMEKDILDLYSGTGAWMASMSWPSLLPSVYPRELQIIPARRWYVPVSGLRRVVWWLRSWKQLGYRVQRN